MPTVVSSRALVPVARRIRNAPEQDDASKAVVLRKKQAGEDTEDLSKALIIRASDDGKDDRQALVLYRRKGGPQALRELAEWHKSSTLLPPFRLIELLRIAESQFLSCLSELQKLQDPLYFHDDMVDTIKATREYALFQANGGDDPLKNPTTVTHAIASRIHNAYFRTAAWKYVRDHARLLQDLGLNDINVYAQIKGNPALCLAYLETYEMLRQIEASGQHEVGLLASASPYYMKHFKDNSGIIEWDPTSGMRLNKSLVDTIVIEMILPQSRYPMSILMLCLRDAIAAGDSKTTERFTQGVTLQLLDMMDTPISASDARAWRLSQTENINATFSGLIKSSQGASGHVAGINSLVVPLTKTKTPAILEKIWESVNKAYVDRAGMDIDILWGLEDSMNPEPQWSAWAITRTQNDDDAPEAKNARALVPRGPRSQHPDAVEARRQRRLAIANEPTTGDYEDMPILESESEGESDDEDNDGWTEDESEDEEEHEMIRRQFEAMIRQDAEEKKAQTSTAGAKSPERKGNPFKTLFRSLRGRFLTKNPILSVDPQPPHAEFDERDEDDEHGPDQPGKKKKKKKPKKKTGAAGGEDDLPGLIPIYPYKGYAPDLPPLIPVSVAAERLKAKNAASPSEPKILTKKNNVMLEEVEDADTHKAEGSGKKKKKVRTGCNGHRLDLTLLEQKKKKAKKAGEPEPADDDDEPEEAPAPQTPVMSKATASAKSPPTAKSTPKSPPSKSSTPKSPSIGSASASSSTLYTPQPETARSGLSYMKSEGISVKTKSKSRPEEGTFGKLGSFMSRTFGHRDEETQEESESKKEKMSGMSERLRSYMKSVNTRAIGSWERILGADDSKGQSGLEWNEFVKAMVNFGFSYDESSAGSRVRFDPPNKDDKDPWLHPKRVKAIARDLNKMYGFGREMLFEPLQGNE
ncbi:hypothetical protein FRC06_006777 [Ceratobasidium sp. 370]|nr:hypothetical protein FRC06_006777 [Ceratobasidium sp. 370]